MRNNLTGQIFNRLLVLAFSHIDKYRCANWLCVCDCNNKTIVQGRSLVSGNTKSCGCRKQEASLNNKGHNNPNYRHGMNDTPTHASWQRMKQRCINPNSTQYKWYGARGIIICDRWINSFENFLEDMGERPRGLTLDRRDNEGNYEPDNCRWATWEEQCANKRKRKRRISVRRTM